MRRGGECLAPLSQRLWHDLRLGRRHLREHGEAPLKIRLSRMMIGPVEQQDDPRRRSLLKLRLESRPSRSHRGFIQRQSAPEFVSVRWQMVYHDPLTRWGHPHEGVLRGMPDATDPAPRDGHRQPEPVSEEWHRGRMAEGVRAIEYGGSHRTETVHHSPPRLEIADQRLAARDLIVGEHIPRPGFDNAALQGIGQTRERLRPHPQIIIEHDGLPIEQERHGPGMVQDGVHQRHQPLPKPLGGVVPLTIPVRVRHHGNPQPGGPRRVALHGFGGRSHEGKLRPPAWICRPPLTMRRAPSTFPRVELLSEFFDRLRDLPALVQWAGYVGLTAIIFAETGLLVGFFLPGDSLLVTAGLLAADPSFGLNVWLLGAILMVAAIVGDTVGYHVGKTTGPRIFRREDSLFFHRDHLLRAQAFYDKHGGKTIIIARFMPIVRTFAPVVAGVGQMAYRRFVMYNVVGGVLWIWSMLLTGWVLARTVPGVAKHVEKIILLVVFLSILPGLIAWWRERQAKARSA